MTYYDDIAEGYDELYREEQLKKIAIIKPYLVLKPTDFLLDVGCGSCFTIFPCHMVGVDPSWKLLKKANLPSCRKVCTTAEVLPFANKTFDHVVSLTAIQNFDDISRALSEIGRVAKPHARIIITVLKKSKVCSELSSTLALFFSLEHEIEEEKDFIFIMRNI